MENYQGSRKAQQTLDVKNLRPTGKGGAGRAQATSLILKTMVLHHKHQLDLLFSIV